MKFVGRFKKDDVVAHAHNIGKYYVVLKDTIDGIYEVRRKEDEGLYEKYETFFFMEEYLLSIIDRRDRWLDELLEKNIHNDNK